MPGKMFNTKDLQLIVWRDHETAKVISDRITSHSRWSVQHECVFELDGHYYLTHYSVGATEQQDERPYQYSGEQEECTEVVPAYEVVSIFTEIDEHSDFWHHAHGMGYLAGAIGFQVDNPFDPASDAHEGWASGYVTACNEQASQGD